MQRRLFILLIALSSLGFDAAYAQNFWQPTSGPSGLSVYSIAITASGHMFAGTKDGVFRSTDDGGSWVHVLSLTNAYVNALAVNPSGYIFAGTGNNGMFRSTDNGGSWRQVNTGLTYRSVKALLITPSSHIFAGTTDGGIFRSSDNGESWTQFNNGLTKTLVLSFAVNSSGHIFAGTNGSVFRSTNSGVSWTEVDTPRGSTGSTNTGVYSLAINSNDNIFCGIQSGGVRQSTDNGSSWKGVGLTGNDVYGFAINSQGHIFAGTESGAYRSTDTAATWEQINKGLANTIVLSFAINSAGYIFVGIGGNGVFRGVQSTASRSLYVSTSGNDANAGTAIAPLRNIQTALTRASSGDTVKVASGTYVENLTTAVKVILRGGYDATFSESARSLIRNKTIIKPISGTMLSDGNSSTVDGFVFDGSGGAAKGVLVTAGNSTITHNVVQGVSASGGSCFEVASTAAATIKNNTAANNILSGGGVIIYSFYIKGNAGNATVVQNNIAYNNNVGFSISASGVTAGYNCAFGNTYQNFDVVTAGATDLVKDPKFVNPANSDFRLKASSPCINAGNPSDAVGVEPSPNGNRIDIGAYGGTGNATPNGNPTTYVATSGNDANAGSISAPYKTIQTAMNNAFGDTVKVASGSYSEGIITASQAILLGGYENTFTESRRDIFANRTTLVGVSTTMVFDRYGSTFDGLFLDGNAVAQVGFDLSTGSTATHNVIIGVTGGFGYAVRVSGNATVVNNTIRSNTRGVAVESGAAGSVVKNNIIASSSFGLTNNAANGIAKYNSYFGNSFNYSGSFTTPGTGDLAVNPQFRSTSTNDHRLASNSPCIDAGDPTDPVGDEPVPNNTRIDMGAYGGTKNAGGPLTLLLGEYTSDANTVLLLHMNETSGTTVSDVSINSNNGTATGTTIVGGKFGKARGFLGGGDEVRLSSPFSGVVNNYTIEAWIYVYEILSNSAQSSNRIFNNRQNAEDLYVVISNTGKVNFHSRQTTTDYELWSSTTIATNRWYQIACTYDNLVMKIFINGVLDTTRSLSNINHNWSENYVGTSIGNNTFDGNNWEFHGLIDEVRISNKARSPSEFNLQLPPKSLTASASGTTIALNWQNGGGAVGLLRYKIYRGTDSTSVSPIDSITSTSYSNTGLTAGVRYFYRVNAVDSTGFEGAKSYAASATTGNTPLVTTNATSSISSTSATLNGTVNPNGSSTTAYFEWGTSSTLVTSTATASQSIGSGLSVVSVTANLTGLSPNTTYYYRVVGQNSAGIQKGSIVSFTTTGTAPTVTTNVASSISSIAATLNGSVNPNGLAATAYFEWGTSSALTTSTATAFQSIGSGTSTVSVTANLAGLSASTTYYYRVVGQNSAGTQKGSIASFATSLAAPAATTLSSPANGATNQPTTLTLSWNVATGATSYSLQVSTNQNFTTTVLDDSTITGTSRQVGPLAYNATYYWRVNAKNAGGTSPFTPASNFSTVAMTTVAMPAPLSFPPSPTSSTDYRLVSIPGVASAITVGDILSGTQKTDWRVYQDNGAASNFLVELSSGSTFSTGEGYWFLKKGTLNISRTVTLPSVGTDGMLSIPLHPGWNIIGNPFEKGVQWSAVRSANGLSASLQPLAYNGSYVSSSTIEPFSGYYFDNRTAGLSQLKIPYPFGSLNIVTPEPPRVDWKLQLVLESDINADRENYIGIAPSSAVEQDEMDTRKPPLFLDQGFLYFDRPRWDSEYCRFAGDFRPALGDGQVWDFEVRNPRMSRAKITVRGVEQIPADYDITLLNFSNSAPVNVRVTNEYSYQTVSERMRFKLIVGKKSFVQTEIQRLVPESFSLDQNYPNPFNPSTSITFRAPRSSYVRLELYSLLGQRIITLVDGSVPAGVHTVPWNAMDESGQPVASGIYIYKITAEGFAASKKMILLR